MAMFTDDVTPDLNEIEGIADRARAAFAAASRGGDT